VILVGFCKMQFFIGWKGSGRVTESHADHSETGAEHGIRRKSGRFVTGTTASSWWTPPHRGRQYHREEILQSFIREDVSGAACGSGSKGWRFGLYSGVPPIDRKNCMDGVKSPCRIPVSFDFTLAPDYRTINRLGASKIQVFFRIDPYNVA
jgi:hypothetical protein